jgi:hypothetical protein
MKTTDEREKRELLKITIIAVPLGLVGIALLTTGASDLVDIIRLKFFDPDKYARVLSRYAEITGQPLNDTAHIAGMIFITVVGILLTAYFIWYLVLVISHISHTIKTRKKKL